MFNELKAADKLRTFKNGLEVLEYLKNCGNIPDILFLDLDMPIMGGLEALREIRKNDCYRDLSIAIYSTLSAEKDKEATFMAGANVYIEKPHDISKLKEVIKKVLLANWYYMPFEFNKETFVLSI